MSRPAPWLRVLPGGAASDAELVEAVRAGDVAAGRALYQRYTRMVNGLALRLLGSDDELDDVVQEVFLRAFHRLSTLEEPKAFRGWLGSIVVRTVQDHLTKRRRRWWRTWFRRSGVEPDDLIGASAPPDVAAEIRVVYGVIERLDVEERVVLVLRRIEEYSMEEIVTATGLSESTVRRRLASAEKHLVRQTDGTGRRAPATRSSRSREGGDVG